jgi:hypothetical protein
MPCMTFPKNAAPNLGTWISIAWRAGACKEPVNHESP